MTFNTYYFVFSACIIHAFSALYHTSSDVPNSAYIHVPTIVVKKTHFFLLAREKKKGYFITCIGSEKICGG